jgi:CheY-like chemotaxis protein
MSKKILVADDEPDILRAIQFRLSKRGYEVVVATNGQEALDKIDQTKPDLVLLDFLMPVFSGLEVCKRLKENTSSKKIPIIIISASPDRMSGKQMLSFHIDGWIIKPFETEGLFQTVERFLQ